MNTAQALQFCLVFKASLKDKKGMAQRIPCLGSQLLTGRIGIWNPV